MFGMTFCCLRSLLVFLVASVVVSGGLLASCGSSSAKLPQIHLVVSTNGKTMSFSYTVSGEGRALAGLLITHPDGYVLTQPLGIVDSTVTAESTGSMPLSGTYTYKVYARPAMPEDDALTIPEMIKKIDEMSEQDVVASGSFVIP